MFEVKQDWVAIIPHNVIICDFLLKGHLPIKNKMCENPLQ